VREGDKPLVWLHGEVRTPPFSAAARIEAGVLLRNLQRGAKLSMPHSRPMPSVGPRCHELRIRDAGQTWQLFYRIDRDAIVISEVVKKKTQSTPKTVVEACKRRFAQFDRLSEEGR
jgi:phage-related protein